MTPVTQTERLMILPWDQDASGRTFGEAEKEDIKEDLQKMISFIEKLNQIDTTNVEPQMFMSNEINIY